MLAELQALVEAVASRLNNVSGGTTVVVKIRNASFETATRSAHARQSKHMTLYRMRRALFESWWH
jgi:nucleotidyltransferase/DNA polymerase involved in DNA repair